MKFFTLTLVVAAFLLPYTLHSQMLIDGSFESPCGPPGLMTPSQCTWFPIGQHANIAGPNSTIPYNNSLTGPVSCGSLEFGTQAFQVLAYTFPGYQRHTVFQPYTVLPGEVINWRFRLTLCDDCAIATDNIGVFIGEGNTQYVYQIPAIDSTKNGWVTISGSHLTQDTTQQISIGSLDLNVTSVLNFTPVQGTVDSAVYYIDNFCVWVSGGEIPPCATMTARTEPQQPRWQEGKPVAWYGLHGREVQKDSKGVVIVQYDNGACRKILSR